MTALNLEERLLMQYVARWRHQLRVLLEPYPEVRARLGLEWIRRPELDRRIRRGDDFAGDAWQRGDEIRYTAPGHRP